MPFRAAANRGPAKKGGCEGGASALGVWFGNHKDPVDQPATAETKAAGGDKDKATGEKKPEDKGKDKGEKGDKGDKGDKDKSDKKEDGDKEDVTHESNSTA